MSGTGRLLPPAAMAAAAGAGAASKRPRLPTADELPDADDFDDEAEFLPDGGDPDGLDGDLKSAAAGVTARNRMSKFNRVATLGDGLVRVFLFFCMRF